MGALIDKTRSGGFVFVSFWQFLNSAKLAEKAEVTTHQALKELGNMELNAGDYLLGWQHEQHTYRYCHSFTGKEIDKLVKSALPRARLADRFQADGKSGNLNSYAVLQVI